MKLLTIVVPVYNTEKYIKRCLDSIVVNSIKDKLEVLIVSDGSKDGSIDIAKEYEKKYPETVKIIEKENGGHGSTINKGLEIATGKYFRVLDSDDWFDTDNFIKFINLLGDINSDLVVTDYSKEHVYDGKSEHLVYKKLTSGMEYDFDNFDIDILDGEYFVMATSTYKTDILRKSGLKLLEKTFYVDMQYNVVPIVFVKKFTYLNLDVYRYFIGRPDQSINTSSFVKNHLNHDKVVKWLIDFYIDNEKKLSNNKTKYIKMILKYLIFTHYSIYCIYFDDKKSGYKLAKEFDKYLAEKSSELYNCSDISFIKIYRRLGFIPVLILFNRLKNKIIRMFKKRR